MTTKLQYGSRHWWDPYCKQGDVECYSHEAIVVLLRIETLRQELYSKSSIRGILANDGYNQYG